MRKAPTLVDRELTIALCKGFFDMDPVSVKLLLKESEAKQKESEAKQKESEAKRKELEAKQKESEVKRKEEERKRKETQKQLLQSQKLIAALLREKGSTIKEISVQISVPYRTVSSWLKGVKRGK